MTLVDSEKLNLNSKTSSKTYNMKIIKKFALALAILLSQFTTEAQTVNLREVGKIENGNLILTVDANTICQSLSKNLARVSTVNEQFTKVDLVKIDSSYFIVFQGSKWKTTFAVVAIDGKLMANVGVSCSTSDTSCSNSPDCAPSSNVGECVCSRCSNAATCTKTCTTETLYWLLEDEENKSLVHLIILFIWFADILTCVR